MDLSEANRDNRYYTRWFWTELARFTFYISLASFFVFFSIDRVKAGFISNYLDLRWVLGLSLILGLCAALWGQRERDKHSKWFVVELAKAIFPIALITYLVYFLFDDLLPGSVSNYINLNWVLAICLIAGVLSVFTKEKIREKLAITKKDYTFIVVLAILGGVLIWWKTKELGWLSWVISIISGALIVIISVLLLKEEETC